MTGHGPADGLLRKIPAVDVLMQAAEARWPAAEVPRPGRGRVRSGPPPTPPGNRCKPASVPDADPDALGEMILADVGWRIRAAMGPHYRKVVNATGIILHTALGRAVLPARAVRQIADELSGYSLLQADLATGQRVAARRSGSSSCFSS